jgi:hypothetical protein
MTLSESQTAASILTVPDAPPAFHLLAKPTGAVCNLDCSYCFFLSKEMLYPGSRFRMADGLLETYLQQLIESHARVPEVQIARQGGEPTLMGLDFFRRSVELAERYLRRASAPTTPSRPTARCSTTSGPPSSKSTTSWSGSRSTARRSSTTPTASTRAARVRSTRSCVGSPSFKKPGSSGTP